MNGILLTLMRGGMILAVGAVVLLMGACRSGDDRPGKPRNVVLISLDDLGARHVGCYGYSRNTTPFIDSLAKRGVLFENIRSQETWTLPSHVSLLTSRFVDAHGVHEIRSKMPEEHIAFLPQILKDNGYETFAVTSCVYFSPQFGLSRGFDHYWNPIAPADADAVTGQTLDYLESHDKGPFFLFLHYFDVHSPFKESNPYRENYARKLDPEVEKVAHRLRELSRKKTSEITVDDIRWLNDNIPGLDLDEKLPEKSDGELFIKRMVRDVALLYMAGKGSESMEPVRGAYDNGVANMDLKLSELFEQLEAYPWFEDTIFIITSDHGEAFNDHPGILGHGGLPYCELTHVPLILYGADMPAGLRIAEFAPGVDIAPTILDYLNLDAPDSFQGRSLLPLLRGERCDPGPVLSGSKASQRLALVDRGWSLIMDMEAGKQWLYRLDDSGWEKADRSETDPDQAKRLFDTLMGDTDKNREFGADLAKENIHLDEEMVKNLKALGYL